MNEPSVVDAEVVQEVGESGVEMVPAAPGTLFRTDDPAQVLERASEIATALSAVIEKQKLYVQIGGRKHIVVEAWLTLGAMLGVTPVCTWTHRLTDPDGWEARVEARTLDGRVIGAAEAECLRAEKKWKSADDYALRSMAQCVPLRTRIFTKRGFVSHEDVRVGENVLAYDIETDRCVWTPLRAVNRFGPEPVVRASNRSFDFTCTPDHSWAVEGGTGRRSLAKTSALGVRKIILAAQAPGGDHPMSSALAEVLGWVITDGTIRYPRRGNVRVHIDQSKIEHVERLRHLLGTNATEAVAREAGEHTFPSGVTYATRQAHRFSLTSAFAQELLALAGISGKGEVVTAVTSFSVEARQAMLRAMLAADGARRPSEGGFEGGRYRFSKQNEAVMETFRMLCVLEGHALGRLSGFENINGSWQPTQTLRANRFTSARTLKVEPSGSEPVWCPTTDHGTWVAELDGNVAITGNTRATSKALGSVLRFVVTLAGYAGTPAEEMPSDGARPPSEKQVAFLRRLLKGDDAETVIGFCEQMDGQLVSRAIDALKDKDKAEVTRAWLSAEAAKWATAQPQVPAEPVEREDKPEGDVPWT